uniref:Uncharacterized protein n=1 Tax=Anguilla anguilla TaxID=7936 RepID=A0A0E9TF95_ANGAN
MAGLADQWCDVITHSISHRHSRL